MRAWEIITEEVPLVIGDEVDVFAVCHAALSSLGMSPAGHASPAAASAREITGTLMAVTVVIILLALGCSLPKRRGQASAPSPG